MTMTVWAAILLGLVQGIAEFLPISSSGHLSVLQNLFHLQSSENGHLFFDVLLHLGTLTAIVIAYWSDIVEMVRECVAFFRGRKQAAAGERVRYPAGRLALMIILGTLPLFLILPLKDYIENLYYNTLFVGVAFLLTGSMLYVADKIPQGRKSEKNMRVGDALLIGLCQIVATIPGISRSGATISGGIATGLDRNFAVKFSLLLSLPAVLGANLITFVKALEEGIDTSVLPVYLIGMLVAAVSGYFAIWILRKAAKRGRFGKFAYYCWGAGVVTVILSLVLS
jgi:undecaprenyl-diphosphatase